MSSLSLHLSVWPHPSPRLWESLYGSAALFTLFLLQSSFCTPLSLSPFPVDHGLHRKHSEWRSRLTRLWINPCLVFMANKPVNVFFSDVKLLLKVALGRIYSSHFSPLPLSGYLCFHVGQCQTNSMMEHKRGWMPFAWIGMVILFLDEDLPLHSLSQ